MILDRLDDLFLFVATINKKWLELKMHIVPIQNKLHNPCKKWDLIIGL